MQKYSWIHNWCLCMLDEALVTQMAILELLNLSCNGSQSLCVCVSVFFFASPMTDSYLTLYMMSDVFSCCFYCNNFRYNFFFSFNIVRSIVFLSSNFHLSPRYSSEFAFFICSRWKTRSICIFAAQNKCAWNCLTK